MNYLPSVFVAALCLLNASDTSVGQLVTFTHITEIGEPQPPFNPPILGSNYVFYSYGGIYQADLNGNITILVDETTSVPGTSELFGGFDPFVSGNDMGVAFIAGGSSVGGVYRTTSDGVAVVADTLTAIPGEDGAFAAFGTPTRSNLHVAFPGGRLGPGGGYTGAYRQDGTDPVGRVADTTTTVPGGVGPFLRFDGVGIDEFYTAFAASSDGQPGSLYLADVATGQLLPIADVNTPIPGSNLTFNVSDSPLIDEGRIAFRGYRLESFVPVAGGVYVYDIPTAQITPIIELFDPLPGGDILGEIQFPSISGDTVGFAGRPGDEFGPSTLFAVVDGQVYRIIGEGDTLDGHFVQTLIYRPEGHNGRQFAFAIQSQGSAYGAIYVATLHLPCPADFNSDTLITSADISAFLSAWFLDLASGTLAADFNASGVTGSSDITAFLSAWFAALAGGC